MMTAQFFTKDLNANYTNATYHLETGKTLDDLREKIKKYEGVAGYITILPDNASYGLKVWAD